MMASLMSCSLINVIIWDGRKSIEQSDFPAHTPTRRVLNSTIQTQAKIYSGLWQLPKQSNYCSCQSVLVYPKCFWDFISLVNWPSEDDNTEFVLINSTLYTFLCDIPIHREANLHHFSYLWGAHRAHTHANTAVHPLLPDWSVLILSKSELSEVTIYPSKECKWNVKSGLFAQKEAVPWRMLQLPLIAVSL